MLPRCGGKHSSISLRQDGGRKRHLVRQAYCGIAALAARRASAQSAAWRQSLGKICENQAGIETGGVMAKPMKA
jgi:hypothetical protein